MKEVRILGVMINNPMEGAPDVQKILTKYGCSIHTRLGLHDVNDDYARDTGLMLLELIGDPTESRKLEKELLKVNNVEVKSMVFNR